LEKLSNQSETLNYLGALVVLDYINNSKNDYNRFCPYTELLSKAATLLNTTESPDLNKIFSK